MARRWLLALGAALAAGLAHAGVVEVAFEQPDRFADAGRGVEAETLRQALTKHLQTLGRQGLPAGQTLKVTVTDIDLAGEVRPRGRFAQEIRVLNGRADWPVISLRYSLSEGGRELARGSERLLDMSYLDRPKPRSPGPYPYEERLLTQWFAQRFGSAAH
jgi:hypothetical protein